MHPGPVNYGIELDYQISSYPNCLIQTQVSSGVFIRMAVTIIIIKFIKELILGKIWTVLEILHWGEDYFRKHSISSPRLTMELLLCNILNCQRIDLYLNYDRPLLSEELDKLHNYII